MSELEQLSDIYKSSNYKFQELLAQGGMGRIYLAEDTRLERTVAIKILKKDERQNCFERALNEARLLARLNHPNIVQIHNVLQENKQVALVMEYVKGKTLQQFQHEHVTMLTQKLQILCQVCDGLTAAHKAGIVHCDLKPANILISENNVVKITDFGIAQLDCEHHDENQSYGSQATMSPEQLQGNDIDYRSDLFSLGILAFTLISGRHPFGAGSAQQIALRIINEAPANAHNIIPMIPPELAKLLNHLLANKPQQRPDNTQYVAERFKQILIAVTQEEIINEQTLPVISDSANKMVKVDAAKTNPNTLFIGLGMIFILLVVAAVLFVNSNTSPETRQIIVLRPTISESSRIADIQKDLVIATIDDAIRQAVINNKNMRLISRSEVESVKGGIKAMARITGAKDVITSVLDCNKSRCNVTFSRLGGKDWAVQSQQHWPTQVEHFNEIYQSSQLHFVSLYPEFEETFLKQHTIDEQDYLQYIQLYAKVRLEGLRSDDILKELKQVIINSPYLFSAYGLFREASLNLYAQTRDPVYSSQLQQMIQTAPPEYRYSVFQAIDSFWLAVSTDQHNVAKKQLEIAADRGVDNSTLNELEAYRLLSNNELGKAIHHYQQAIILRPSTKLLYNLALSYWLSGDYNKAKKTLKRLLDIVPDQYAPNQLLASINLLEGDVVSAIATYEKIVATHPQSIDLSNLGLAYSLIGQHKKAFEFAELAVHKSPEHPTWVLNLADAQMILGEKQQAQIHYQRVIELLQNKNDTKSWLERAQAYVHIGDNDASIKALNKAKKLAPDNGEVSFAAALIYARLDEYVSAVSQVEEALDKKIGVIWFNLPWFDVLCGSQQFNRLMVAAGNKERCER